METSKRKYSLTPAQQSAFDFITEYMDKHEHAPTIKQISEALGYKAESNAHRLVHALRDRNWIDFMDNHSRTIVIL